MSGAPARDHGGGIDSAAARYGGTRGDWLDLSTGINPIPYPLPNLPADLWQALPDRAATAGLERAARRFWHVPPQAAVLAAPGASALIAALPGLPAATAVPARDRDAEIPGPTYNEHAAAFRVHGWRVDPAPDPAGGAAVRVLVHPNNPDGRLWSNDAAWAAPLTVIDESFADTCPADSLIACAARPGTVVLKSFGKFWGLAGLRLGFAIGDPTLVADLAEALGPWPVSGPALRIGAMALSDPDWAAATRARLAQDTARLDALATGAGAALVGGTTLFRLYAVADAFAWQTRLAEARIWSRTFPQAPGWLRLGLPGDAKGWTRLEAALCAP